MTFQLQQEVTGLPSKTMDPLVFSFQTFNNSSVQKYFSFATISIIKQLEIWTVLFLKGPVHPNYIYIFSLTSSSI